MSKAMWHWTCRCECAWVGTSDDSDCFACGDAGERGAISLRPSRPETTAA